ncbi:hypothetical protein GGR56DRAFT_139934 [Xylariaceae sp. FL0804]|nr:hypothetical protein GGR56DRAFT_139934 [Xylariaceae sp. FL0804]
MHAFGSVILLAATVAAVPSLISLPRETCWSGEIHSSCDGFTTGCTPDGYMAMVISDMCLTSTDGTGTGTCHYDADCNASC